MAEGALAARGGDLAAAAGCAPIPAEYSDATTVVDGGSGGGDGRCAGAAAGQSASAGEEVQMAALADVDQFQPHARVTAKKGKGKAVQSTDGQENRAPAAQPRATVRGWQKGDPQEQGLERLAASGALVGRRVRVYFDVAKIWYGGTIDEHVPNHENGAGWYRVRFDDCEHEYIGLPDRTVRVLRPGEEEPPKRRKVAPPGGPTKDPHYIVPPFNQLPTREPTDVEIQQYGSKGQRAQLWERLAREGKDPPKVARPAAQPKKAAHRAKALKPPPAKAVKAKALATKAPAKRKREEPASQPTRRTQPRTAKTEAFIAMEQAVRALNDCGPMDEMPTPANSKAETHGESEAETDGELDGPEAVKTIKRLRATSASKGKGDKPKPKGKAKASTKAARSNAKADAMTVAAVAAALMEEYPPCGAGHARGAQAVFRTNGRVCGKFDDAGTTPVPCSVGEWIADPDCHWPMTMLYKYASAGYDLRHMEDRVLPKTPAPAATAATAPTEVTTEVATPAAADAETVAAASAAPLEMAAPHAAATEAATGCAEPSAGEEGKSAEQPSTKTTFVEESFVAVPGWIGVTGRTRRRCNTTNGKVQEARARWHVGYSDSFAVVLWDGPRAMHISVNGFGTVEEAATFFDKVILVAYGPEEANLNYPLSNYADFMRERGFGAKDGGVHSTTFVIMACRLLEQMQFLASCDALDARSSEIDKWRDKLRVLASSLQTSESTATFGQALLFIGEHLTPSASVEGWEAVSAAWREDLRSLIKATRAGEQVPFMPVVKNLDKLVVAEMGKELAAAGTQPAKAKRWMWTLFEDRYRIPAIKKYGTTFAALMQALVEGGICMPACLALEKVGEPGARALAAKHAYLRLSFYARLGATEEEKKHLRLLRDSANRRVKAYEDRRGSSEAGQLQRRCTRHELPPGLRVVVIGAGVSGLYAATRLEREGAQVVVLEGRDRIGGRMNTHTLSGVLAGGDAVASTVDLGASFICGTDPRPPVNPIFSLIKEEGIRSMAKHRDGAAWFDGGGVRIPRGTSDKVEGLAADVLDALLPMAETCGADLTIAEAVEAQLEARGEDVDEETRRLLMSFYSDVYVEDMSQLGLKEMVSEGYSGHHELIINGYKRVVERIRDMGRDDKPLRDLRLGTRVTGVRMVDGGGCVVSTDAGEEIQCHAVLCTLSLGVLQCSAGTAHARSVEAASKAAAKARGDTYAPPARVRFEPPLPPFKLGALERLRMGTENRVALLFQECFWGAEHFLRPVDGAYSFFNNDALGLRGVISAWIRPQAVQRLEAMTDEEARDDVLAALREMFPDAAGIEPLDYVVTRWASDPFAMGAYSCVPVGASRADYDRLAMPLTGDPETDAETGTQLRGSASRVAQRLYFAGEATFKEDSYTVHGAYASGIREAKNIAAWWHENHLEALQWEVAGSAGLKGG